MQTEVIWKNDIGQTYHEPIWITRITARERKDAGVEKAGWYWAFCHPGCLPDSEFNGPFRSEVAAYKGAKEFINTY